MNDIKDLMTVYESLIFTNKEELKNRKQNINSSYQLAKHDFRVIENIEDTIETLQYNLDKLKDLQERIIDRNSILIKDL